MSGTTGLETRSPADVGFLPWLVHRVSALLLFPLVALHVAVQAFGYVAPYQWGVYGLLLDLTLGLVLLHGALGVRATLVETRLSSRATSALIWAVGIIALALLLLRLFG